MVNNLVKINKVKMPKFNTKANIRVPSYANIQMGSKPRKTISTTKPPILPIKFQKAKHMNWNQAKAAFPKLAPFGDADKDHVVNMYDCKPFDYYKHAVRPSDVGRPVHAWSTPGLTFDKVFQRAEKALPHLFKEGGHVEDQVSDWLTEALEGRTNQRPVPPFKDIVGIYKRKVTFTPEETNMIHLTIKRYLNDKYPNKDFYFDHKKPSEVTVVDYDIDEGLLNQISFGVLKYGKRYDQITQEISAIQQELESSSGVETPPLSALLSNQSNSERQSQLRFELNQLIQMKNNIDQTAREMASKGREKTQKISKVLGNDAPEDYKDLLKHLGSAAQTVTFWITDDPSRVMTKSTVTNEQGEKASPNAFYDALQNESDSSKYLSWTSCERVYGPYSHGVWHDIELHNAIVYIYLGGRTPKKDRPSGRIMLRWGKNDDTGEFDVGVEAVAYPWGKSDSKNPDKSKNDSLRFAVQEILQEKGYFLTHVTTPYRYAGYSDVEHAEDVRIGYYPYDKPVFKPHNIRQYKINLSKQESIPEPLQVMLAKDESEDIQARLAGKSEVAPKTMRALRSTPYPFVQEELAARPDLLKKYPKTYFKLVDIWHQMDEREQEDLPLNKKLLEGKEPPSAAMEKLFTDKYAMNTALNQPYGNKPQFQFKMINMFPEDAPYKLVQTNKLSAPVMSAIMKADGDESTIRRLIDAHGGKLSRNQIQYILKKYPRFGSKFLTSSRLQPTEIINIWNNMSDVDKHYAIRDTYGKVLPLLQKVIKEGDNLSLKAQLFSFGLLSDADKDIMYDLASSDLHNKSDIQKELIQNYFSVPIINKIFKSSPSLLVIDRAMRKTLSKADELPKNDYLQVLDSMLSLAEEGDSNTKERFGQYYKDFMMTELSPSVVSRMKKLLNIDQSKSKSKPKDENSDFSLHDMVRVHKDNASRMWVSTMDKYNNKIGEITEITPDGNFKLTFLGSDEQSYFTFDDVCLELVNPEFVKQHEAAQENNQENSSDIDLSEHLTRDTRNQIFNGYSINQIEDRFEEYLNEAANYNSRFTTLLSIGVDYIIKLFEEDSRWNSDIGGDVISTLYTFMKNDMRVSTLRNGSVTDAFISLANSSDRAAILILNSDYDIVSKAITENIGYLYNTAFTRLIGSDVLDSEKRKVMYKRIVEICQNDSGAWGYLKEHVLEEDMDEILEIIDGS